MLNLTQIHIVDVSLHSILEALYKKDTFSIKLRI